MLPQIIEHIDTLESTIRYNPYLSKDEIRLELRGIRKRIKDVLERLNEQREEQAK